MKYARYLGCAILAAAVPAFADPIVVASPNGGVKAELSTDGGMLRYSVSLDGKQILAPSSVVIQSDGVSFGNQATLGAPAIHEVNETYAFWGAKSKAVNHAREATVPVTSGSEHYNLDLHVADDGVGIRLRLPAKQGRKVEADTSTWKLAGTPTVWATPYDSGYEQTYYTTTLAEMSGKNAGLPLTAKVGNAYVTLSEAALKDYGDLGLHVQDGALVGYLPNDRNGWTTDGQVVQPWRVTIIAHNLTELVNTTLIQNLNPPPEPALQNADWIIPGRSTWQWLSSDSPKFPEQHQWVDWTKELGYEYYLVDDGWKRWPDSWNSLESVCTYAKSQGVKVWLWVNASEVKTAEQRATYFKKAASIGIVGVKVDFPPATNRTVSNWYQDTARDAAANKLLIDFHGATKPTGMERTWPNELTREGIRGHEYHVARLRRRLEPQHDVILPFTRYVVGHADYTPTDFDPRDMQGNSWAHELAEAIVFTSPFLCTGGNPKDYLANPAKDVISALPSVWDETIVLPGSEPGKVAGMARRHGDQWFIGVMNGADATSMDIPLNFLGAGDWKAIRLGEVADKPDAWDRREETVNAKTKWQVPLRTRGGFVAWIKK